MKNKVGKVLRVDFDDFFRVYFNGEIERNGATLECECVGPCWDDCYHCDQYEDGYQYCPREGNGQVKITGIKYL